MKQEWIRDGYDIGYSRSNILRDGNGKKIQYYYNLTFSYEFKYDNDLVYFAHSYPYTASHLQDYLNRLTQNEEIV